MKSQFNHLIASHGILTAFSIARRVSPKDIKDMSAKIKKDLRVKKQKKTQREFDELLKKEILKTSKYAIEHEQIPGLITSENNVNSRPILADDKRIMQLNYAANNIAKKWVREKTSKDEICYMILSLLNTLGLSDQDFKDFNKKYGNQQDNEDEDDGEGEGDF